MFPLRRSLALSGLACLGLLAACNDRGQMEDTGVRRSSQPFLGPIPARFRSTVDAADFKARVTGAIGRVAGLTDALALTDAAPPAHGAPDDVLPELAGCHTLRTTMGGFLTRRALHAAKAPDPSVLIGASCDAALATLGLTFVDLERALQAQTATLAGAAPTPDACTSTETAVEPEPFAAVAESFERKDQPGKELALASWPLYYHVVEGGADDHAVALYANLNTQAVEPGLDGKGHLYGQWTAVATLVDAGKATIEKKETVTLRPAEHPEAAPEASLERHATVTLQGGADGRITERVDYVLTSTTPTPVTKAWTVELVATPGGRGALDVTVGVTGDQIRKTVLLELGPDASGACLVKQ